MLFSGARVILPGKTERARDIGRELEPHRAEYQALNERYGLRAHEIWVSRLVDGTDIVVNTFDIEPDDLQAMRARTWDPDGSAYDRWWLELVRDVCGVDLATESGFAAPPEQVLSWRAGPAG